MAKFIAVDANGLNALFSGSKISFVQPHCKKKNSPKQTKKTTEFAQADLTASQVISLSGYCTSQFQFEIFSWETPISKSTTVFSEHLTSILSYLYIDNDSPPPRLA